MLQLYQMAFYAVDERGNDAWLSGFLSLLFSMETQLQSLLMVKKSSYPYNCFALVSFYIVETRGEQQLQYEVNLTEILKGYDYPINRRQT